MNLFLVAGSDGQECEEGVFDEGVGQDNMVGQSLLLD